MILWLENKFILFCMKYDSMYSLLNPSNTCRIDSAVDVDHSKEAHDGHSHEDGHEHDHNHDHHHHGHEHGHNHDHGNFLFHYRLEKYLEYWHELCYTN